MTQNPDPSTEITPGALFEIKTPDGLVYAQMTHLHPSYPPVVRVLKNRHPTRPYDLTHIAAGPTAFRVMVPIKTLMTQLDLPVRHLGPVTVPPEDAVFPTFRMPVTNRDGKVLYWWFWNGASLRYDTELDTGAETVPLREITDAATLRLRILSGL